MFNFRDLSSILREKKKKKAVNFCFDKSDDHAGDDRLYTSGFESSFQK